MNTTLFVVGYVGAWTLFSVLATLLQWALHESALISPAMQTTSSALGAAVLIAAGVYQWTPLKHACLRRCRSPFAFLLNEWRTGAAGAFAMGIHHGALCTACCWLLMAVLFVVGVMNLAWIVVITAFVVAEKVLPHGDRIARYAGVALVAWGATLFASTLAG